MLSKLLAFKVLEFPAITSARENTRVNIGKSSLEPKISLFLFESQLWRLLTLLLFNSQQRTVPHLKDLIHICLEPEDQDPSRALKKT